MRKQRKTAAIVPTHGEIIDAIAREILAGKSPLAIRDTLVHLKEQGVSRNAMLGYLEEMRGAHDEDSVLELIDFVVGFCNPKLFIFHP